MFVTVSAAVFCFSSALSVSLSSGRYTAMQDDSMTLIFRTIFGNFLERFSAECKALAEPIVAATVGMYNTILADLRPTPAKSHYTYNLRDLSKVFQVKPCY